MKPQSAGGKIMAIRQREAAIAKYYENPNFCRSCKTMIKVRENEKVPNTRKRKFCTRSCGASYVNKLRKREKMPPNLCSECETPISREATRCMKCYAKSIDTLRYKTKGEILSTSKYWVQWRVIITKNARKIFKQSEKPQSCIVCGYNLHADICHLRGVSDFPISATIAEINNPKNLEALCKNHHWEFDNGLLKVKGIKKARKKRAD